MAQVMHYFCWGDAVTDSLKANAIVKLKQAAPTGVEIKQVDCEICFNVQVSEPLTTDENKQLQWLFADHAKEGLHNVETSFSKTAEVIEVGPRLNVQTPFSTNALAICESIGLTKVSRVECTRRYAVVSKSEEGIAFPRQQLSAVLYDRMTECLFATPVESFALDIKKEQWADVDVMGRGSAALVEASDKLGLAFDQWDIDYYTKLFKETIKRNPTTVECFDLSQSNSEHSRHWFFCGRQVVDGVEQPKSLMKMVKATQVLPNNSVIAFHDNSSAITGFDQLAYLKASKPDKASELVVEVGKKDITLTAETHNFPTGVAPFPGATTGTGGRIRDNQSTGRGANVIAGTSGYCVGNLHIPGYDLPWEDKTFTYPSNMASPLEIEIEASNGASDYGNKFGEPVILGYTRSFGMRMEDGDRREWVKPIMFSAGIGSMDPQHLTKMSAKPGNLMVKVGGPAYRIGMGGGSASSVDVQGGQERDSNLDFNAVQRGDAEMEQKMNRVIRACIEMGDRNPICSIHDQGAGGNGNVLKEICEPSGGIIRVKDFIIGDPTLSTMELWGAEYQENNALLLEPSDKELMSTICARERVPIAFVGEVTGSGRVVLEEDSSEPHPHGNKNPYDMDLGHVLSEMPTKVFKSQRATQKLQDFLIGETETVSTAIDRVLRLLSVGSKRFLTNKVDRSVTGLIAQQQCVGPLHMPLSNVAVVSLSHLDTKGAATSIGEQPIKMLVNVGAGARMSVAEGLTNIIWANVSDLKDIKCSGNWMWAAKLATEGAALFDACKAMCDIVTELGFALDGGKDSLSMACRVPAEKHPVKAPGELVMSLYAPCPDVTLTITPDLEPMADTVIIFVDISGGKQRLGGSALAQCFNQIGSQSPDVDSVETLEKVFRVTQKLIAERGLVLAGHDRSDGGLITALIEMAISGNCGIDITLPSSSDVFGVLFSEELGLLLQVRNSDSAKVIASYSSAGATCTKIGNVMTATTAQEATVKIVVGDTVALERKMVDLRDTWETTSFELEMLQSNVDCVQQEKKGLRERKAPPFTLTYEASPTTDSLRMKKQCVAIIREEGSNGDREMVASLHMAGFTVTDVTMQDIQNGTTTLDAFRGVVFVGGFSFADTCGSAKGWAAGILMNPKALSEFDKFKNRTDTFSLGVCNGCQLLGLLGWVGGAKTSETVEPATKRARTDVNTNSFDRAKAVFTHNTSGRFESRFSTVQIKESPALMLKDMQGSTLGVWVAHGEGRARFLEKSGLSDCLSNNLAPIRYVDDDNNTTMQYPFNPNGSPEGIAALCSIDGRHLAMMPHPERCVLPWQWPWMPADWKAKSPTVAPWIKMFQNAKEWCDNN